MTSEEFPRETAGAEKYPIIAESHVGRVLFERFLVEDDLTDLSLGGGFVVYPVKDLKNFCRRVMLKAAKLMPDDSGAERPSFQMVCEVLRALRHPNVEDILEAGRLYDGRPYALAVNYRGVTLDRMIADEKRLELDRIARYVEEISEAVDAAHSKGILHCDLRPSNVFLSVDDDDRESVRMINFGSAWPVDVRGENLVDAAPGSETLLYTAPESLMKLGHRSAASDIYSLSVLVYRLVTGFLPFGAAARDEMLATINAGAVKSPAECRTDLSEEAATIILSGLQFEPALRPRDMADFGLRLIRALRPPQGIFAAEAGPASQSEPAPAAEPVIQFDDGPYFEEKKYEPAATRIPNSVTRHREPAQTAPTAAVSDRAITWVLIILLMAGAVSIPIGQTLLADGKNATAEVGTIVERPREKNTRKVIRYRIEPPKLNANTTTPMPIRQVLSGGGQLTVAADTPGDAFVFSEIVTEDGRSNFRMVYPQTASGDEASKIETDKPLKLAAPAVFPDVQKTKAVWIVWSAAKYAELESIRGSAANGALLNEDDGRKLRHFLERNRDMRVRISTDEATGQTVLDSSGERIVHRIELDEG